jgi:hypothetical protein
MFSILKPLTAAAILVGAAASANAAAVFTFGSDADFNAFAAGGNFTKTGGTTLRAGNRAGNGDWELGIVDAGDFPTLGLGQLAMSATNGLSQVAPDQGFTTYLADGTTTLSFVLDNGASESLVSLSGGLPTGANAVFLRARTPGGDAVASLTGLSITFLSDMSTVALGDLVGGNPAQYVGIVSHKLAGGFTIGFDAGQFDPLGFGGSNVILQTKIGTSVVPEPATWAMLITGFGLVGAGMRRRRLAAA